MKRYRQPRIPNGATSQAAGARNLRSALGSRRRSTNIAAHTATNAASVPALASAAIAVSGIRPANTEVTTAVKIVIRTGAPRLDTLANDGGRSPSRATVKKIRLWPKKKARMTVGKAMTADAPRMRAAHG